MYQKLFKYPKFCLKAQVAGSAKFWKCTLPFVLIGGKFGPVSKTTDCLMKKLVSDISTYHTPISHEEGLKKVLYIVMVIIIGLYVSKVQNAYKVVA